LRIVQFSEQVLHEFASLAFFSRGLADGLEDARKRPDG